MVIQTFVQPGELPHTTATILHQAILEIHKEQKQVILGLPGGRSISPILKALTQLSIPWNHLHVFLVDERIVPQRSSASNFRIIKEELQEVLPMSHLHAFHVETKNPEEAILQYEQDIKTYGGHYDITLVSAGEDGHIASLFPHHHSLSESSSYVFLEHNAPKPPPRRMSISPSFLLRSLVGIIVFSGLEKKEALKHFLDDNVSIQKCPAKLVLQLQNAYLITDNTL